MTTRTASLTFAFVLAGAGCARVNSSGLGTGGATTDAATSGGLRGSGGAAGQNGGIRPDGGVKIGGCQGLQCQQTTCMQGACAQPACPAGAKTTISGTVYDPAGRTPLYNAIVYLPNAPLASIADGVTCDKCDGTATGSPIASALTDSAGHFTLDNAPVGSNIPLVIQIGKWRRQVAIADVARCVDNPVSDPNLLRLPRNQSEGHLPQMALTTGHADALECLLRKIGVTDSEFTTDTAPGRVHMYYGGDLSGPAGAGAGANAFTPALGGGVFSSAKTLWGNLAQLMKYDMLLLSCEGSQYATAKMPYVANIKAYADAGGRMFTDHLQFYWLNHGPTPWPMTANYIGVGSDLPNPFVSTIDQSFPKGVAFAQWLVTVGATTAPLVGAPETIQILQGQYSVQATVPPYTQRWIYADQNPNDSAKRPAVEYMTMNTPAELAASMPASQCGRVVFTDLHVVSAATAGTQDTSHPGTPFPLGCVTTGDLSPQEKALEFMLFDLSSCIQPESVPPVPPIIP